MSTGFCELITRFHFLYTLLCSSVCMHYSASTSRAYCSFYFYAFYHPGGMKEEQGQLEGTLQQKEERKTLILWTTLKKRCK